MKLTSTLGIRYPVIMAPMFLVSNEAMVRSAMEQGIAGTFPSLNYRHEGELKDVLDQLNQHHSLHPQGTYGVNLIVQKTNPLYAKHLQICADAKVPLYITSLGSPKEVIAAAHSYGAKVLCDVTNLAHAEKAAQAGCDGFIAVTAGAGGHAGPYPMHVLIPSLQTHFPGKLLVAAGGIAHGNQIASALLLGADGVSIGTRFIASHEASVSDEYKNAILQYGMDDIVLTERLSGTPCNIINTPTARKIGYKQNWFEKLLNNNSRTRKYFKMLVQLRGMKKLEQAVKPGNYQQLWSAGQSVELVNEISSVAEIVHTLVNETRIALNSGKDISTNF
ncbi:NAD(P)H-dependent flavin oxidoreductase [Chitinophaga sancti]|uniref:Nitronate monooxygenase n=1 Tax=Chitinophaga sancti TaxID=1004 RepID=A0A1K1QC23_9BACT|nr:nitronate monooxygenase family protein [Chitinophaga sancti]WQD61343.1 nitronate monooxygenase family protein [Chitinophaga sancti]WQG93104.1 nitronate monooxygenase family protein [Chitinophaga sancti]SFW57268.1 nitronate monooxygenase [Chitinophaga sancti]